MLKGHGPTCSPWFQSLLWGIKWGTFVRLRVWGVQIPGTCFLCNSHDKSRSHLFFICPYSRAILLPLAEFLNHSFWKLQNMPILSLTSTDIRLGDLTEATPKFTHHYHLGVCYGTLLCHLLGISRLRGIDDSSSTHIGHQRYC